MFYLNQNKHKINSILLNHIDCGLYDVKVEFDETSFRDEFNSLFSEYIFINELIEGYEKIDSTSYLGRLNLPCDPDYYFRFNLYYSKEFNNYFLEILE